MVPSVAGEHIINLPHNSFPTERQLQPWPHCSGIVGNDPTDRKRRLETARGQEERRRQKREAETVRGSRPVVGVSSSGRAVRRVPQTGTLVLCCVLASGAPVGLYVRLELRLDSPLLSAGVGQSNICQH